MAECSYLPIVRNVEGRHIMAGLRLGVIYRYPNIRALQCRLPHYCNIPALQILYQGEDAMFPRQFYISPENAYLGPIWIAKSVDFRYAYLIYLPEKRLVRFVREIENIYLIFTPTQNRIYRH